MRNTPKSTLRSPGKVDNNHQSHTTQTASTRAYFSHRDVFSTHGIRTCYNDTRTAYVFYASGHPAIRSTHPTTLEITTEDHLTRRGDCIIAVRASKGLADLPGEIRKTLSTANGIVRMTLLSGSHRFAVEGRGALGLSHSHPTDIVVRKSNFVSDRTLMVDADKAAADIPRDMVQLLRDPSQRITVEISTLSGSELP